MSKRLIIASTSTLHQGSYLDYLLPELATHFADADEVLFIPYARPSGISHDTYTAKAQSAFTELGKNLRGIHTFSNPVIAVQQAKAIFTGGGNTFVLVNALHQNKVMQPLREKLLSGTPYLGTSAGSNICGVTMQTTNDMPIIYPPSFKTLGVVPFNINPHYLDPVSGSSHMGETRETRIKEFHSCNTIPVIGLREGSWLKVTDKTIRLQGTLSARVFTQGDTPYELETGKTIDLF